MSIVARILKAYNCIEVIHMKLGFDIIDGVVYVDKKLYTDAQQVDNNISKLVGSPCVNLFKTRPAISTGIDSVTIDYRLADGIEIDMDPMIFVNELRSSYDFRIRGHLVVDIGNHEPVDMLINRY